MQKNALMYFFIILFLGLFFFKLFQMSSIIFSFPKEDYAVHIADLFFLKKHGFHGIVPEWYDGLKLFLHYPPAFSFFALPIYLILGNLQLSFYISILFVYVLAAISILFLSKVLELSKIQGIFLFVLFFGNPISFYLFNFIGRITELFAFVFLIFLTAFLIYFKDKELDRRFLLFIPLLAIIILSHPATLILSLFVVAGFIFYKKTNLDRIKTILFVIFSFVITSFWWFPFIAAKATFWDRIYEMFFLEVGFESFWIFREHLSFILFPMIFLILLYFYLKEHSEDKMFFLPSVFLAFLIISHLILFIPVLNKPYPFSYYLFFIFLIMLLFFRLKKPVQKAVLIFFICIFFLYFYRNPWQFVPTYSINDSEALLLPYVENRFIFLEDETFGYSIYSLGTIKYGLSTPFGWYPQEQSDETTSKKFALYDAIYDKNCNEISRKMEELKTNEIISIDSNSCKSLGQCGLLMKKSIKGACLYSLR